jgi:hypothetical protein
MNIGKTTDVIVIELVEEPHSLPLEQEQDDAAPPPALQPDPSRGR